MIYPDIHGEQFTKLVFLINKELVNYQKKNTNLCLDKTSFLVSIGKSIDYSVIDKNFVHFDDVLNPSSYGWRSDVELPSIEWLSAIIASHLINYKLAIKYLTMSLSAITYLGFYGLFEIFENVEVKEASKELQFEYYRKLSKYHKEQGNYEQAQDFLHKAIFVSKKSVFFPYALVLLSKFYSDYLQRNGISIAYSKIVYNRITNDNDTTRRNIICLDTYAKNIKDTDYEASLRIYRELISITGIHSLSLQRIKFRYLELEIDNSIKERNVKALTPLLKEYDDLIQNILKNPKAKYIRNIHFIGFFRKIIETIDSKDYKRSRWLYSRVSNLKNQEAEFTLNECINEANKYRDRKNISIAYFEKSFWSTAENEIIRRKKVIDNLTKGLSYMNYSNHKSIFNKIYTKLLFRLAETHITLNNWDEAIKYYNKLYDYISVLITELDIDKQKVDSIVNREKHIDFESLEYVGLVDLSFPELTEIQSSLSMDYRTLTAEMIDINQKISHIQTLQMSNYGDIIESLKKIIKHDFGNAISTIGNNIKQAEESASKYKWDIDLRDAKKGLYKINSLIDESIRSRFEKLINPDEIPDLNTTINNYIVIYNFYREYLTIHFTVKDKIKIKIPSELIGRLIHNLIENSREAGIRNNINSVWITVECKEEFNMIFLIYSDNTKEYDTLKKVIDNLNQENDIVASHKNPQKGGNGLKNLKKLFSSYNKNRLWELKGDDNQKTLIIPLKERRIE
ncbi:hypothetical protein [Dysgonomonas termitidis]|uniref:ATP-binding protein n=1 Tax=Dysgonomonas termitidis TaxID=1516126 RepID=A0ABV9KWA0_9BACT